MRRITGGLLVLASMFMVWKALGGGTVYAEEKIVYLKNNIHAQQHRGDCKASYANWTDPGQNHVIIPVNTRVKTEEWRSGFSIITEPDGKKILFEFDSTRMKMSVEEYTNLITSPNPDPVPLEKFSEIDRKGIKDGKAYTGMSKGGVRAALGYPAVHQTPSLESNRWIYWTNRFRAIAVEFDENGKVKEKASTP